MNHLDCNTCQAGQVGGRQFVWVLCGTDTCPVSAYKEVFQNDQCVQTSVYFDSNGAAIICANLREVEGPTRILDCTIRPDPIPGPPGPQGTPGTNGTNGTNGLNGTNGTNGTNGVNGAPGAQGIPGPQGPPGTPAPFTLQSINGVTAGPVSLFGGGLIFTPNGDDSFTVMENCVAMAAFLQSCAPGTPLADVSVVKTISPTTFPSGSTTAGTVTISVSNAGPMAANGMTVTDNIA